MILLSKKKPKLKASKKEEVQSPPFQLEALDEEPVPQDILDMIERKRQELFATEKQSVTANSSPRPSPNQAPSTSDFESEEGSPFLCVVEEVNVTAPSTPPIVSTAVTSVKPADSTKPRKRKWRSLFPLSSIRENCGKTALHEDCIRLAEIIYKGNPPL